MFVSPIADGYLPNMNGFDINTFTQPWLYLQSFMLDPDLQGKGIGLTFFADVMQLIQPQSGVVFLDCWSGNDKLRSFYERAGCRFIAILPEEDFEVALFAYPLDGTDSLIHR